MEGERVPLASMVGFPWAAGEAALLAVGDGVFWVSRADGDGFVWVKGARVPLVSRVGAPWTVGDAVLLVVWDCVPRVVWEEVPRAVGTGYPRAEGDWVFQVAGNRFPHLAADKDFVEPRSKPVRAWVPLAVRA